jgi:hypothetical protein
LDKPEEYEHFVNNLGSAWRASHFTSNTIDLPQWTWREMTEAEKQEYLADDPFGFKAKQTEFKTMTGLTIKDQMPGVEKLHELRRAIAKMEGAGVPLEEINEVIDNQFQDELGALYLRANAYDIIMHTFLDPINYAMPVLKPIEKAAKSAKILNTGRYINMTDDAIRQAKVLRMKAKHLGEVAKVNYYDDILDKTGEFTTSEKILSTLFGGKELVPKRELRTMKLFGKEFTSRDIPVLNFFQLAPHSRARELVAVVMDTIDTHILRKRKLLDLDAPYEVQKDLNKLRNGIMGDTIGYVNATVEGKYTGTALEAANNLGEALTGQYRVLHGEGIVDDMRNMAQTLLQHEEFGKLMKKAGGVDVDEATHWLGNQLISGNKLDELGQALGRTPDELAEIGKRIQEMPYTPSIHEHYLRLQILEAANEQAVHLFGVTDASTWAKWGQALKAAETLAWLRLNPGYALRNLYNNELTMLGRGVTGFSDWGALEGFLKRAGFKPFRFEEGFGPAGHFFQEGDDAIGKALRGKPGISGKVADGISRGINKINLGVFDMSTWAAKHESFARQRAFAIGYHQFIRRYGRKGVASMDEIMAPQAMDWLNTNKPELVKTLQNYLDSSVPSEQILMEELLGDINTNMRSVLDEASSIVGEDLADEFFGLPEEILIDLEQGLPKAIKEGKTVPYLEGVRTRMLDHFDEMGDTVVQRVAQEAEKRMAAGEVHALPEMTANMFDNFSEYHVVHYKQMQHLDNYFTRNMSAEVIDRTWKRIKDGNNAWFNRGYKRLQGVGKGIERGWNKKFPDTPLPNQFSDNLKTLGDEWKKFHKIKNSDLEKYFKAKRAGKTPKTSFEDLRTKHTEMYREMVEVED